MYQVGEQDLLETLAATVTAAWRFRQFTESRWLTVGTSCRAMVLGVLTGLDSFFAHLKEVSD